MLRNVSRQVQRRILGNYHVKAHSSLRVYNRSDPNSYRPATPHSPLVAQAPEWCLMSGHSNPESLAPLRLMPAKSIKSSHRVELRTLVETVSQDENRSN